MKKLRLLLLMIFVLPLYEALPAHAVIAKPEWQPATLTDGTMVMVMPCGDEFGHYFVTADGQRLIMGDDLRLHPLTDDEPLPGAVSARRLSAEQTRTARRTAAAKQSLFTDSKRGLIILVSFDQQPFKDGDQAQATWTRLANEEGYSEGQACGSMHDYFLDQSYGLFDLTFDVVGPVPMPHTYSYYGKNDSKGEDDNVGEMIYDACVAIDDQVDFSTYDWDGNGEADQIFVIYAGYGENEFSTSRPDLIWPHSWGLDDWNLASGPLYLDGVHIDLYACTNELAAGGRLAGIGTACHEFSHCLGLPDTYNTKTGKDLVVGGWDLMSTGCYNNRSWRPAAYSSYERYYCGWLTPTVLDDPCEVTDLKHLGAEPRAFLVRNDAISTSVDEYYMIENRQPEKWDSHLPGKGLLIWHIDYNANVWDDNTPNVSATHYRIDIIAAGDERQDGTAAWPTTKNGELRNALTDNSTPRATVFNTNSQGKLMGKPITHMAVAGDIGCFRFKDTGKLAADVNADGTVDVGDVMAVITCMAGNATPMERYRADVNGDGHYNVGDVMAIINQMAKEK